MKISRRISFAIIYVIYFYYMFFVAEGHNNFRLMDYLYFSLAGLLIAYFLTILIESILLYFIKQN